MSSDDTGLNAQGDGIFPNNDDAATPITNPDRAAEVERENAPDLSPPAAPAALSPPPHPPPRPQAIRFLSRPPQELLSSQLENLSRTLVFSDDAVSTLAPWTISYASATRKGTRQLFSHSNLGLRKQFKKKTVVGRHDNRGPGHKHLPCHLTVSEYSQPGLATSPLPGPQRRAKSLPAPSEEDEDSLGELAGYSAQPRNFVRELEQGAKPVFVQNKCSTILLDNDTLFKKVLQTSYPRSPLAYCSDAKPVEQGEKRVPMKRWLALPQNIQPSEEVSWECRSVDTSATPEPSSSLTGVSSSVTELPQREELFAILQEWRKAWKLQIRLKDVSDDAVLLRDMQSLNSHVRIVAIYSVALLAESEQAAEREQAVGGDLGFRVGTGDEKRRGVSSALLERLQKLLDDPRTHVQVPTAITLIVMGRQDSKSEKVLWSALDGGSQQHSVEEWAAVQSLVCLGAVSAQIVSTLLHYLNDMRTPSKQKRAAHLLAITSSRTNLVHTMLADQLNNSGWPERWTACNLLPKLHGGICKDHSSKLLLLAWDDWSPEVRQAAAKAIGLIGLGKLLHDEIVKRLSHPSVLVRLDALRKLQPLNVMTTRLLPNYLACFTDKHISVRMEAVALAGSLQLREPQVLKALKRLLRDPCWMLKARTLQALAEIGEKEDKELVELLIWAVRFEKESAVRAEACRTIARLGLGEERVIRTLKDVVTVEDDVSVARRVLETLVELGHSDQVCDEMLQEVCEAVKTLGTADAIVSEVANKDRKSITGYAIERPDKTLTVRDYLDYKRRYKMYPDRSNASLEDNIRSWSPDRKTINAQLNKMKERIKNNGLEVENLKVLTK